MRRYAAAIAALLLLPLAGSPAAAVTHSPELDANPSGRWIVVLKSGADAVADSTSQSRKIGFSKERTFRHALRGYSATMSRSQAEALGHEADVAMVVPDEVIHAESQVIPTGISRIGGTRSTISKVDNRDSRVDADVAIVDTGIAPVPDLNVVGGYSCANSSTAAWQDLNGHGTHVAGTVGAIDNGSGVVGVAPGVRLWAVKILDANGAGLLSWYLCGLDWIAAQRDRSDPSRPLFEAANMSVAKYGRDDGRCGLSNHDVLHRAICRLVASGVTVVAAAANDSASAAARVPAAYNEVITVSALADTDGRSGGLGGHRCFSWGTYDYDDTFADFSNYGSDVDLIAPGKCIYSTLPVGYGYMSGTSMAAPHVTGAVALLKANRPYLTPAEVREALAYLGSTNWKSWTDPDRVHERLLDVSRIGARGSFTLSADSTGYVSPSGGGTARLRVTVHRSPTSFERVRLGVSGLPSGAIATFSPSTVYGFLPGTVTLSIQLPTGSTTHGRSVTIVGNEHGNTSTAVGTIDIDHDSPTASPPASGLRIRGFVGTSSAPVTVSWPAGRDETSGIGGYEVQRRHDGGTWTAAGSTSGGRSVAVGETVGHAYQYRVRARDWAGNWSAWVSGGTATTSLVQETSGSVAWSGRWTHSSYRHASAGATRWSTRSGSRARLSFTGRGVAVVVPVGPTRGRAAIYLDGVYKRTVSMRASKPHSRMTVYAVNFSAVGHHRIEFRVTGSRRVDLDAFVIRR